MKYLRRLVLYFWIFYFIMGAVGICPAERPIYHRIQSLVLSQETALRMAAEKPTPLGHTAKLLLKFFSDPPPNRTAPSSTSPEEATQAIMQQMLGGGEPGQTKRCYKNDILIMLENMGKPPEQQSKDGCEEADLKQQNMDKMIEEMVNGNTRGGGRRR